MAFAQLTYRESLRDIECCLRAMQNKLYHIGIRGNVSRNTLADANGQVHDVNILDELITEPGSIYVMDRGYLDFDRRYRLHQSLSFFVTRKKINTGIRRIYSAEVDKSTGLTCDQVILLDFLTNNFSLPAFTTACLYKSG